MLIDTSYGGYRRVIRWLTTLHTGSYDTVTVKKSKVFKVLLEYFKPLTKVEGGIVQILLPINPINSIVYTVTLTCYYTILESTSTRLYTLTLQFELYSILDENSNIL